ncbi:competence protein CoiA [Ornithinibacillus caprae]|uniref:competence protein CoiA n=1 Tax=Ornithinibacillus caprae TaxID=2678566 RepID=UPI0018C6F636|nr:competence protein CoiA family protein [Ornithinibacillus caprae]
MLQAKTQIGVVTSLTKLTSNEILELKKHKRFFCPTCNEEVIIKAGSQVAPHFAHLSKVNCPANEKGEGAYHEQGKLLLLKWLKDQGYQVSLEAYLPKINQRPDILLKINGKHIAIEYQCARIPTEVIHKRNTGYRSIGITPLWILGANQFKRESSNLIKIDPFTLQFLHQFKTPNQHSLYYFDPNTNVLTTAQDLYEVKKRKALAKLKFSHLDQVLFRSMFLYRQFTKNQLLTNWIYEKNKFRVQPRKNSYGNDLKWKRLLYQKGIAIDHLPSIIYLPVSSQFLMKTPLWDWQSRIVLDMINPLKIGAHFSIGKCFALLRNQSFSSDHFSMLHTIESPIKQYLQWLCKLNIIQQRSATIYEKIREVEFYQHIEEAVMGDKQLIYTLMN